MDPVHAIEPQYNRDLAFLRTDHGAQMTLRRANHQISADIFSVGVKVSVDALLFRFFNEAALKRSRTSYACNFWQQTD